MGPRPQEAGITYRLKSTAKLQRQRHISDSVDDMNLVLIAICPQLNM